MGQVIPRQHPAVVLRSHYRQLKALLAITMIAIVGLSLTVAILATDDESSTTAVSERTSVQQSVRPEETGVAAAIAQTPEVARPDESKVAASIARTQQLQAPSQQTPSQHDESDIAAAISGK
jgi:hypothetical protein